MLKRVFNMVAILAIVNLVAMLSGAAYLLASGRIDGDRLNRIRQALVSEAAEEPAATTQPTSSRPAVQAASEKIEYSQDLEEILARRLDRQRRELGDLLNLADAARLKLLRDREAFEREQVRWGQMRKAWEEQQHLDGFKKTLTYLEGMDPKIAKGLLRDKKDADAARYLSSMNERKGRAIIEECVSQQDREWIGRILQVIERGTAAEEPVSSLAPVASGEKRSG